MPDSELNTVGGNILEDLVDCLEQDLLLEQEKHKKTRIELERLKGHLLNVDQELNDEAAKRDQLVERFKIRTAELQQEVQFWRQKHDELLTAQQGELTDEGTEEEDEILAQIERATKDLEGAQQAMEYERQRSADLLAALNERDKEINDLQSALEALEKGKQREIEIGVAESRAQLSDAQDTIKKMTKELEDLRSEAKAVPDLKRKIAELDVEVERLYGEITSSVSAKNTVNKELVSNLIINLFDRQRPVDRQQVAVMLCDLLGIAVEDRVRMGVIIEEDAVKEEEPKRSIFSFADQWIAFLSNNSTGAK